MPAADRIPARPLCPARAEPGITDNQILLGQSAAFTGPTAPLGIQFSLGAKVYLDKINSKGGVYGRRIEIRALDDQYDPDLALKIPCS